MKNVILIGMMGCGKSTVGAILARRLGMELNDTDAMVEEIEGRSIPTIFAEEGEEYFRGCELAVAEDLSERSGRVVACGGGLPLRRDCIAPLKTSGTVFFLRRDPGAIYDSVSMEDRPLGQAGREAFLERYRRREPVYEKWADHIIEGHSTPEEAADMIMEVLDK